MSRGYLNRPDLTAERFIANPFGAGRLYRTGDMVRWRPDGELEFLGRADTQVKINGLRMELGEIEACLSAMAGIAAAVAVVRQDRFGVSRLYSYATTAPSAARPDFDEIKTHLGRSLPRHMIPSAHTWLEGRFRSRPIASSTGEHCPPRPKARSLAQGCPRAMPSSAASPRSGDDC